MAKHVTTISAAGFDSTTEVGSYSVEIDPTGESAPDTLESLLGTYAACYIPALRVGAEQRSAGELGHIEIAVTGELNENDKLDSIAFAVSVDADLSAETAEAVIDRANALCKVHDALKADLHATVTIVE